MKRLAILALVCATSLTAYAQTDVRADPRTAAIRATIREIESECQRDAAGDWNAWYAQLAGFRAAFKAQFDAAKAREPLFKADPTTTAPLFRTNARLPIYEWPDNAMYLWPATLDTWVQTRPSLKAFTEVSLWLKNQGIDLIVVPAPRIAEVYGDEMVAGAPADKILAPHVRRLILELSNANVEVVDLLPVFLKSRDTDPEPLYLHTDGHWSDRAQRIAAREIASRLNRYAFVKTALAAKPQFLRTPSTIPFWGSLVDGMTKADKAPLEAISAAMPITKVTAAGAPFVEPDDSPIVVIGDSFTHYFQLAIAKGSGIDALLSSEINIPVSNVSSAGATTDPIKEFVRRPELIRHRKVVIWIENSMAVSYDGGWTLPPLPK